MKQIKLSLIPAPGAKPEFLADLALANATPAQAEFWNSSRLPDNLVLEAYTRDGWAWKPGAGSGDLWTKLTLVSKDGRKKLPGFVNYLKQRQKSAYGRFAPTGLMVVSYVQSSGNSSADEPRMDCRIAVDLTKIPDCNLKPLKPPAASAPAVRKPAAAPAAAAARKGGGGIGGGLLGRLVGAQQRTNHHVAVATTQPSRPSAAAGAASAAGPGDNDHDVGGGSGVATGGAITRTAQQVLADFRKEMQDKMLDFDLAESEEVLKVEISLSKYTAGLSDEDKSSKVTMEILKYMVYEAAEEVNEEWIAHKEPSEFMDEAIVAVYKEGAAPEDVLEDVNKGELPDEVRGQQRALQEERQRQQDRLASRNKQQVELDAHRYDGEGMDDEFSALNTNKRDRRTIEDFERERKKGRTSS